MKPIEIEGEQFESVAAFCRRMKISRKELHRTMHDEKQSRSMVEQCKLYYQRKKVKEP